MTGQIKYGYILQYFPADADHAVQPALKFSQPPLKIVVHGGLHLRQYGQNPACHERQRGRIEEILVELIPSVR